MHNEGRITALDRDAKRLKRLQKNVKITGATNIEAVCQSFLDVDPDSAEYRDVKAILLDPSCSSSGTVSFPLQKNPDKARCF